MGAAFNAELRAYDNIAELVRDAQRERSGESPYLGWEARWEYQHKDDIHKERIDHLPELPLNSEFSDRDLLAEEVRTVVREVLDQLNLGADDVMTEHQWREAQRIVRKTI